MLYSEFVENVGCRDNKHNYTLYRRLELIYMNDDTITKPEIYEMGRKLMDNSKTEEELELESKIKAEIEVYKHLITEHKQVIDNERYFANPNKEYIKYCKSQISYYRHKIAGCKWVLGTL